MAAALWHFARRLCRLWCHIDALILGNYGSVDATEAKRESTLTGRERARYLFLFFPAANCLLALMTHGCDEYLKVTYLTPRRTDGRTAADAKQTRGRRVRFRSGHSSESEIVVQSLDKRRAAAERR